MTELVYGRNGIWTNWFMAKTSRKVTCTSKTVKFWTCKQAETARPWKQHFCLFYMYSGKITRTVFKEERILVKIYETMDKD